MHNIILRCMQAATIYLVLTVAVQYYVREAPHFYGMWHANISNVLLSWTYMKAIGRAAIFWKTSVFGTHADDATVPAKSVWLPNPEMPDMPQRSECLQNAIPTCCAAELVSCKMSCILCTLMAIALAWHSALLQGNDTRHRLWRRCRQVHWPTHK
jgi:hypothetical protein